MGWGSSATVRFEDPIYLYWSIYDHLWVKRIHAYIGSQEASNLDKAINRVAGSIEPLQRPGDIRRVYRFIYNGNVIYDVIDDRFDELGFPIDVDT